VLAVRDGVPIASAGLLVDDQFAAEVARKARASGYTLAMPSRLRVGGGASCLVVDLQVLTIQFVRR
jgi:hypothetical protein